MKITATACAPCAKRAAAAGAHVVLVHLLADGAVAERPLGDLKAHVAIRDRREVAPQAPGVAPVAPAHLQHVAEPLAW